MPEGILFWAVAGLAVLIVSFSKGGFAGGGAIAGVPLMTIVIDPVSAAGIMLPLLIFIDAISVWAYRGKWDVAVLKTMLPGAIIGIGLGGLTFQFVDTDVIRLLLGLIVGSFIALRWFQRRTNAAAPPRQPSWFRGSGLATVAGFTSTVAHAGQPPVAMYMLPLKRDRTTYQATNVLLFAAINYTKILPYALLGMLDVSNLEISLMLAPLVPVGTLAGVWLHSKVSDKLFLAVVYAGLVVIGAKLIYDGVAGLL
ncbi:MAG: sulfite exporter TauE/SafE family protein [Proteobacteria bacterium]|nr:sulfite exporter TauE/SafE family protein [Pseudomonadota bacterium]